MIESNNISYKDSAARVIKKKDGFYRYIFQEYKDEYDHLMNSGLYDELTRKGLLIKHQEVYLDVDDQTVYRHLFPEQIQFQSYPFEWCYSQWREALIVYLQINLISLKYGMVLKDATPYNFYISGGKAVMFDTSSFAFFRDNQKWLAYRQFCEEFLGPFTLMHNNGSEWAKLSMSSLRGLSLPFISKNLPLKTWFNLSTLINIHLHSRFKKVDTKAIKVNKKGFTIEKLKLLTKLILHSIKKWEKPFRDNNHWTNYYDNDIESVNYLDEKEKIIKSWLEKTKPESVIDLGANTGNFSFIAANYSNRVIALENDHDCVELINSRIKNRNILKITCLTCNLLEPSPSLGLVNEEIFDLFKRGKSDMVFALALTHHLFITYKLSFDQIINLLERITTKHAIVEFVEINDRKVKQLLSNTKCNVDDYSENKFVESIEKKFKIQHKQVIHNTQRILYIIEKNKS